MAKDGITFAGKTVDEATKDSPEAMDDYLAWAEKKDFKPEKPLRGEFLVRASPELHWQIATASAMLDTSICQFVIDAAKDRLRKANKTLRDRQTGLWRAGLPPCCGGIVTGPQAGMSRRSLAKPG